MRAIAVSDVPKERKSDCHQDALFDADRDHCQQNPLLRVRMIPIRLIENHTV